MSQLDQRGDDRPAIVSSIRDLSRRVERLESANRNLRRSRAALGVIGLVLVVGVGANRAGANRVVEAEKFRLMGHDGKLRAELGVDPFVGDPALALWSVDGRAQSTYFASGLSVDTREIKEVEQNLPPTERINLHVGFESEMAELVISDRSRVPRSSFGVDVEGNTRISLVDHAQKEGFNVLVGGTQEGVPSPSMEMRDKMGKVLLNPTAPPPMPAKAP